MSFLFKSSKNKQQAQSTALPPATRNIPSSHGPNNAPPNLATTFAEKQGYQQNGTAGSSANNSLSSLSEKPPLQGLSSRDSPDQRPSYDGPIQGVPPSRGTPTIPPQPSQLRGPPTVTDLAQSPYPWSHRRINFVNTPTGVTPFPRYGAAVNPHASKDGSIFLMGGLIHGSRVTGDLWMVEAGSTNLNCFPIATTSEGPGPRVGHASLLVGNAFIVFGGDTKDNDGDLLDDTLYLLNTSTKQWSRALPAGPRPPGRYGHSLNILGSKIYVFGGQVEGFFFNDLMAFDLNALQSANNRWELLIQQDNGNEPTEGVPPPRTNHTMITFNDRLYLFGGTDGERWFNDVWSYDPRTNAWSQLECIGFIPLAREGHAAALVGDVMYIFGGRTKDGADLGDLAAFKITTRRWYTFQNMGASPSPRSGHSMTAYGKQVLILGGEPSTMENKDPEELSMVYLLDTSKIRYPADDARPTTSGQDRVPGVRRPSNEQRSGIPRSGSVPREGEQPDGPRRTGSNYRESVMGQQNPPPPYSRGEVTSPALNGSGPQAGGSRLPRAAIGAPSGPPPQQQAPQPRPPQGPRSRTPERARNFGPAVDTSRTAAIERDTVSPVARESPQTVQFPQSGGVPFPRDPREREISPPSTAPRFAPPQHRVTPKDSMDTVRTGNTISRNASRSTRQQQSIDSTDRDSSRPSVEGSRSTGTGSREPDSATPSSHMDLPVDSGVGSSPALSQQPPNDELLRELESSKQRNAWLASELALAKKSGYTPTAATFPNLEDKSTDSFGDEDKPLLEALIKMRTELAKVQGNIETQAREAAGRIAEVERQRDDAIREAVFAKQKLAAVGATSPAGTPMAEQQRGGTPDLDRLNEANRRLAASLAAQKELSTKIESLTSSLEAERRARQVAEETAEASQKQVSELNNHRQQSASEVESLRAELHEAQKTAREESANSAEALASSQLLTVDKSELSAKLSNALREAKEHLTILDTLRQAVSSSSEKTTLLERKLEEEYREKEKLQKDIIQLRTEHERKSSELDHTTKRLRDAEELAEQHAAEARTHRAAVLAGLGKATTRDTDEDDFEAVDERVTILQQQVDAANAMVRKNQEAANLASEKLRRAEERIAGLEAYQEQTSRESLTIRKQLQAALKDAQALTAEKAELQQQLNSQQLEANAIAVQHGALKDLLVERGINPAEARRSRALDSPIGQRHTPDMNRMRELEQQLEASMRSAEEMKASYEEREVQVSKEWEEKLTALDNDHQAMVKYLRGTEKMLSKMKHELQRYKTKAEDLERELKEAKITADKAQADAAKSKEAPAEWERERETLQRELKTLQANIQLSTRNLESELESVRDELDSLRLEHGNLQQSHNTAQRSLHSMTQNSQREMESMQKERAQLEQRATDAEQKVQLLLDQVENSVNNYRRASLMNGTGHGSPKGSHPTSPLTAANLLSNTTSSTTPMLTNTPASPPTSTPFSPTHRPQQPSTASATESIYSDTTTGTTTSTLTPGDNNRNTLRNSMALDSLASELDALRSHWELANRNNHRLSDLSQTPGLRGDVEGPGEGLGLAEGQGEEISGGQGQGQGVHRWRGMLRDDSDDEGVGEEGEEVTPKKGNGGRGIGLGVSPAEGAARGL